MGNKESADLYAVTRKVGVGANKPYVTLDNKEVIQNNVTYRTGGSNTTFTTIDVDGPYSVPIWPRIFQSALVNKSFRAPISSFTPSLNVKCRKLNSFTISSPIPTTQTLKFELPSQIASNVNLTDYAAITYPEQDILVPAFISLYSDKKTIVITPPNGGYEPNTQYRLIVGFGIPLADGSETYESTVIDFVTTNTASPATTVKAASFDNNNKLINKTKKSKTFKQATLEDDSSLAKNSNETLKSLIDTYCKFSGTSK